MSNLIQFKRHLKCNHAILIMFSAVDCQAPPEVINGLLALPPSFSSIYLDIITYTCIEGLSFFTTHSPTSSSLTLTYPSIHHNHSPSPDAFFIHTFTRILVYQRSDEGNSHLLWGWTLGDWPDQAEMPPWDAKRLTLNHILVRYN